MKCTQLRLSASCDASVFSKHEATRQEGCRSLPRRPQTTPKAHVRKYLPSPGEHTTGNRCSESRSVRPSFMTHLPDSPPKNLPTYSPIKSTAEIMKHLVVAQNSEDKSNDLVLLSAHTDIRDGPTSRDVEKTADEEADDERILSVCRLETEEGSHAETGLYEDASSPEENGDDDDDGEGGFDGVMKARTRFMELEEARARQREELADYLRALEVKVDDDGNRLIEFPKNYKRIVSLMTAADIEEDNATSEKGSHSWVNVLIKNSLSKQHAFGNLEEDGTSGDRDSEMESKIAAKMARVRQLDGVLEEKLGKDLYAGIHIKKKPGDKVQSNEIFGKRKEYVKEEKKKPAVGPKQADFIEKNRKITITAGGAKLTHDEESRLRVLLDDSEQDRSDERSNSVASANNAYTLDDGERSEITELIRAKAGNYKSMLVSMDDYHESSIQSLLSGDKARGDRVVEQVKRDRETTLRLKRIDEELHALQESEAIEILSDDEEDRFPDDDIMSVKSSYSTTSRKSTSSTCSTRSVISKNEYQQFLKEQLLQGKHGLSSSKPATEEEIKRLLASLPRLSFSRPSTTRTVTSS